jgi:hypothetical protein
MLLDSAAELRRRRAESQAAEAVAAVAAASAAAAAVADPTALASPSPARLEAEDDDAAASVASEPLRVADLAPTSATPDDTVAAQQQFMSHASAGEWRHLPLFFERWSHVLEKSRSLRAELDESALYSSSATRRTSTASAEAQYRAELARTASIFARLVHAHGLAAVARELACVTARWCC